jgi:hypothetical protein
MNMHRAVTDAPPEQRIDRGGVSSRGVLVAGATLTLFLCGAGAPSPLYAIYQSKFGFSTTVLTAILAVYAVAVLAAVRPAGELCSGRLTDHRGGGADTRHVCPAAAGRLSVEACSIDLVLPNSAGRMMTRGILSIFHCL